MKIITTNYFDVGIDMASASFHIELTEAEVKALSAAGHAAGCRCFTDILAGIIDDAIGIGCRLQRAEEDAQFDLDHLKHRSIVAITSNAQVL